MSRALPAIRPPLAAALLIDPSSHATAWRPTRCRAARDATRAAHGAALKVPNGTKARKTRSRPGGGGSLSMPLVPPVASQPAPLVHHDYVTVPDAGGGSRRVRLNEFRALVLDSSYKPISVVNWKRVLCMVWFGKVDVLEYYPDVAVSSARDLFPVPAVVRVRMYVHRPMRGLALPASRRNVMLRDHHMCQYCGSGKDLSIDHVTPVSKGGGNTWGNLVTACKRCNQKKGNKTLAQLGWKPMRAPREPSVMELGALLYVSENLDMTKTPKQWADYIMPFVHKSRARIAADTA